VIVRHDGIKVEGIEELPLFVRLPPHHRTAPSPPTIAATESRFAAPLN
jgi:hypothetical protein